MRTAVEIGALSYCGLLFISGGLMKVVTQSQFRTAVIAHALMPPWLAGPASTVVARIELGIGLWLVAGLYPRFSLLTAIVLLTVFLAYRAGLQRNGWTGACGCPAPGQLDAVGATVAGVQLAVALCGLWATNGVSGYPPAVSVWLGASVGLGVIFLALRHRTLWQLVDEE